MTTAGKEPAARFENERTCSDLQALKSSPRPGVQSLTEGFPWGAKGTYDGQPYITGLRIAVALGQQSSPPCAPRHNPVSIDGTPSSYRDRKGIAIEAAGRLMAKYPHSAVAVKDLQSGKSVPADYKLDLGRR
jgi:hypothetical protein